MLAMVVVVWGCGYQSPTGISLADAPKPLPQRVAEDRDRPSSDIDARQPAVTFVRAGIVLDAVSDSDTIAVRASNDSDTDATGDAAVVTAIVLPGARQLVPLTWKPLATYELTRAGHTWTVNAPVRATPLKLWTLPLEDVRHVALAGAAPDVAVRFSPDGRYLAVGSFGGWLRVVDVASGVVVHSRRLAEGMVKELAWSPDGAVLYVGEQSPDANLLALDARTDGDEDVPTFAPHWQYRAADDVETSRPPANDRYGVYTLPGVFDLEVSNDGRLFVAATHSWSSEGAMKNRSVVLAFSPGGEVLWRYPADRAADVVVPRLSIDPAATKLAFWASQSQEADAQSSVARDTLNLVDAASGALLDEFAPRPLTPYFARAESWDSLAISAGAARLALGLADGRVLMFDLTANKLALTKTIDLATPLVAGGIPYAAPAGFLQAAGDGFVLQTQDTFVPDAAARDAAAALSPNHGANTLTVVDAGGTVAWRYRGPAALGGAWLNGDDWGNDRGDNQDEDGRSVATGRWLVVACRARAGDTGRGTNGFWLFDTHRDGGGRDRLVYRYPTDGAPLFHADVSRDGRWIAIVEAPTLSADGESVHGSYQVHLVH